MRTTVLSNHKLALLTIVLSLNGCGIIDAYQENQRLKARLANEEYVIELAEREASITRGCEYIINVCPESMLEAGHAAMAKGYSGGTSVLWIIFATLKVTLLTVLVTYFITTIMRIGALLISSKKTEASEEHEKAQSSLNLARQREKSASEKVELAMQKCKDLNAECDALHMESLEIRSAIEKLEEERDTLNLEIDNIKSVRQALDAFK